MLAMPTIRRTKLFIGGEFMGAADGATFETVHPASGETIANIAEAKDEDVDRAVRAARAALEGSWGRMDLAERARRLRAVGQLLEERIDELSLLESLDVGKPIRETKAHVLMTAAWFDFFADIALKLRSSVIPSIAGHFNFTLREPVGVVGLIIPWNYPLPAIGLKAPAALAMGNAIILKPAEQTPLTALAFAEVCRDAGLPNGVVGVLPGYGPTAGRAIVEHPGVAMISFTGSTAVGRDIAVRSGRLLKKVTLELGGKSPNIVFADADLDLAAETSLFTFCVNQGQLCSAGTRLLVEEKIHDDFASELVRRAEKLRIGDPLNDATQLGAVISPSQLDRVQRYVSLGEKAGAEKVTGGYKPVIDGLERGYFYAPTIFTGVKSEMTIAQEEIFGPVLSIIPFKDEIEAARLANDVLYGLAAGVWTSNLVRAHRLAAAIEAGLVYVNTMNQLAPGSPYSGYKQSGLGVEGGFEQAESFSRLKSVWINLTDMAPSL
jgi:acyl-CoA reductase-like NAD-dependent aldehyde dehydrogenase